MLNGIKRKLAVKILNDVLKDEIKKMPANWKTTAIAILTLMGIASNLGLNLLHNQPVDWPVTFVGLTAAIGLFHAADAKTAQ